MTEQARSPGDDLQTLLRQYDEAVAKAPHYRAQTDMQSHGVEAAENVAYLHAVNGNPLPKPQRIEFQPPPLLPAEPSLDELLQPLRERVTAAEALLQRKTAEPEQALAFRNDIERAAASVRNISTEPPRLEHPDGRTALRMSDADWSAYKARVAGGDFR